MQWYWILKIVFIHCILKISIFVYKTKLTSTKEHRFRNMRNIFCKLQNVKNIIIMLLYQ